MGACRIAAAAALLFAFTHPSKRLDLTVELAAPVAQLLLESCHFHQKLLFLFPKFGQLL